MFGIGFGELLIIALVVFLVAPQEIPGLLRKLGLFAGKLNRLRSEYFDIETDIHKQSDHGKSASKPE